MNGVNSGQFHKALLGQAGLCYTGPYNTELLVGQRWRRTIKIIQK